MSNPEPVFPVVALIVSGGHTELVFMDDHLHYQRLGATLDDAAGEAFDKVARLIGLAYPGGPSIQEASQGGNPQRFSFPRAWLEDSWNFSFSGLKTAVLREVRRLQEQGQDLPVADLAASFQAAVVDVLVGKTVRAAQKLGAAEILIVGGVSANQALRDAIQAQAPCPVHIPPIALCTDNAAMIASAGYYRYISAQRDELGVNTGGMVALGRDAEGRDALGMDALPNWPLD